MAIASMVSLPRYIYRKTSTKYRQIHHAWILWDSNRGVPDSPKSHGLQVLVLLPTAVSSRSAPLLVVPAVLIILRETHRGRDEVDIQYIYGPASLGTSPPPPHGYGSV